MPINVSIVEDNEGTRKTLARLVGSSPSLCCTGVHRDAEHALERIPAEQPDVVLMDINLPGMSGIDCVARLKKALPNVQVLMLTTYEENDLIFDSLRKGANGYLLKKMPPAELLQAIEQVHAGGAPMSMQIARKVVSHFRQIKDPASDVARLSPREQEILALLAKGYLYKEISALLGITLGTVRSHLHKVYEKLHVQTRTEAVVKFLGRD